MNARDGVLVGALLGAAAAPTAAFAQAGPARSAEVEEIVVTAQRRSEALSNVPVSVSALSGDAMARARMTSVTDLASGMPNLQAVSTVGEGTPIFALRGVSMSDYSLNQSGPVATYYDEVYKGNFALLGVGMFDLERVEVLRGPQGTLYGKNTTGGAVNLIARRPEFGPAGGEGAVGIGSYSRIEASGAVQASPNDVVAGRLAFTYARADGWFENLSPKAKDLNALREYGLRASVLLRPAEGAEFLLRASTSLQNPRNYGVYAEPGPQGIGAGVYSAFHALDPVRNPKVDDFRIGLGKRELTSDFTPTRRNRTHSVALTSSFDVGEGLKLISITSWDEGRLSIDEDTDGSALKALSILYEGKARQISEDLRLQTDWAGPFNATLGAYYNRETLRNGTTLRFYQDLDLNLDGALNSLDCIAAFPVGCQMVNNFQQRKVSWAAYADTSYQLSEPLKLRLGLRYSHDDGRQIDFRSLAVGSDGVVIANLIPGDPTNLGATTSRSFDKGQVSGKVGLDYTTPSGGLIYASYSRGYRAGAFNAQAFYAPQELSVAKPETIDAVELGWKTQFWERRLRLTGALFWYGYHDQQFIDVNPDLTQTLLNLPRSRILGGELELAARPLPDLQITAGLGLLNSKIKEGEVRGVSVAGNRLANAPEVTLNGAVDWTFAHLSQADLSGRLGWSYVSGQDFDTLNTRSLRQSGYGTLDASLTASAAQSGLRATLWVKNLTDETYFTSRIDISSVGLTYNHLNEPRTYGASLAVRF